MSLHAWDINRHDSYAPRELGQNCLMFNSTETHKYIRRRFQQSVFFPLFPHPHLSFWLTRRLSCFQTISLTCHRNVDKPQKVHQFEGAADHQEDAHSLQPLHLPLVLEEQMHPFPPFLSLSTKIFLQPWGTAAFLPNSFQPAVQRLRLFSLSSQSPSMCRCSAILTPHGSPPASFTEGRLLFSSFLLLLLLVSSRAVSAWQQECRLAAPPPPPLWLSKVV